MLNLSKSLQQNNFFDTLTMIYYLFQQVLIALRFTFSKVINQASNLIALISSRNNLTQLVKTTKSLSRFVHCYKFIPALRNSKCTNYYYLQNYQKDNNKFSFYSMDFQSVLIVYSPYLKITAYLNEHRSNTVYSL